MLKTMLPKVLMAIMLAALCATHGFAQATGRTQDTWWAAKSKGGVYTRPNRPLWKLSDLKRMHAGQTNWQEPIVKDPLQEATYNSAAPGTKFVSRLHPDTATVYVVIAGEMHFAVEGQQPVTAKRGSIINILRQTIFSYDIEGTENALWVEINPAAFTVVYPSSVPPPKPQPGQQIVKIAFPHKPPSYTGSNQLYRNTFDVLANCQAPATPPVIDEHIMLTYAGFGPNRTANANPADNKCANGGPNAAAPDQPEAAFNPRSVFGHMHVGATEWWIIQVGAISGKFENAGEFHAVEGDVLYAPPNTWHQMAAEAPSGPSVRLAVAGYFLFSMVDAAGSQAAQ